MSAADKRAASYGMASATKGAERNGSVFQVRRPDTLQFASIDGVCRMAGVPPHRLRRLIAKEITDNALDECDRVGQPGQASIRRDGDRYTVEDQGRGIPGDAAALADLFCSSRAMLSGKFLRLPQRGALGNGLRVAVAAVALCGETIRIEAHSRRTVLRPRRTGSTDVLEVTPSPRTVGTLLQYTLLPKIIPPDDDDLTDAKAAIALACAAGPAYARRPSPHWLDFNNLAETFATIEPVETTIRQILERLDGCSGAMAGKLAASYGKNRRCRDLSETEIAELLTAAQATARVVKPRSLGLIGADAFGERFDGHIIAENHLRVGTHEPYGYIPVLIEAWASVNSRRGREARLSLFINRTPAVGGAEAVQSDGHGISLAGAGLSRFGEVVQVAGGDCELIVAITAPLIPTTSLAKQPDLSIIQDDIAEALRRAFNRSRNRLPPDPAMPKPPKSEPLPKSAPPPPYEPSGTLAVSLADEAEAAGVQPRDLLVLSPRHDPFNETKASRRDAEWFAELAKRFLPEGTRVHARGLYYRALSAGDVRLPNGAPFIGIYKTAKLIEESAKAARWLGLVPFDTIVDERSAPPEFYDTEGERADPLDIGQRHLILGSGAETISVPDLKTLMPTISATMPAVPRQLFRICMMGEKSSLGEVLRPIAKTGHAELLLATGEVSETAVYGIAKRAAADGRPLRILYFSDFDPAGWQMPISVARKLQAHRTRAFPDLGVRLIRVALTIDQVVKYDLPDAPLKPTEKRARAWRERWGREQVEIDALAALRPDILDRIARAAIKPYFDSMLVSRFAAATKLPPHLQSWFQRQPSYKSAVKAIRSAYEPAEKAAACLNQVSAEAIEALRKAVAAAKDRPKLPPVKIKPKITAAEF